MTPFPPEFVLFLVALGFGPFGFLIGYDFGKRARVPYANRPIIQFSQLVRDVAPVLVERRAGSYARLSWSQLSAAQWRALLTSTSEGELAGEGKPFSVPELRGVRDVLIGRGCAYWRSARSHSQGWELQPAMWRAIVRHTGGNLPLRTGARRGR